MPPRRVASTASKTRDVILDAAEKIMLADGYAAVTSRSVAKRVGMNAGNVHYYFPTLDDLFLAVYRRGAERNLERMAAALAADRPLEALWSLSSDPRRVAVLNELMTAANHRKVLLDAVTAHAAQARQMQVEALGRLVPEYGLDGERFPPGLVAAVIQGTALMVARGAAMGIPDPAVEGAIRALLAELESERGSAEPPD